ncbi:MAG TPA: hypothetical protein VGE67_15300, partial [Haloferula sp.]
MSLRETAKATPSPTSSPELQISGLKDDPSLSAAFSEARHAISEIDDAASQLPGNEGARYFAYNPGQQLSARFLNSGIRIGGHDDASAITITRTIAGANRPDITSQAARVEYRHSDGVVEWWENGTSGLEQGFTVPSSSASGGEVKLSMSLSGMQAFADPQRPGDMVFGTQEDAPELGYRNLKAWDANGTPLDGQMQPTPGGFEITVAANDAVFPITIDPVVVNLQPAILPFAEGTAEGTTVDAFAISGTYAALAMPDEHTSVGSLGAVYMFEFKKDRWNLMTRLLPPLPSAEPYPGLRFGSRICFSGKQLMVLTRNHLNVEANHTGIVHLFALKGKKWAYDSTIRPPERDGSVTLSGPIAASEDTLCLSGTRIEEGTPGVITRCLWVFNRKDQKWLPAQRLESFCYSLATDGDLIVSGGNSGVDVFRKQGTTWAKETRIADPVNGSLSDEFGNSVDVAAGKILVGAPWRVVQNRMMIGSAHLFENVSGSWLETKRLDPPSPAAEGTQFGRSVQLEGRLAYVGAPGAAQVRSYRLDDNFSDGPTLTTQGVNVDFGYSFAVSGNRLIGFGAQRPFQNEYRNYIEGFEINGNAWRSTGILDPGIKHNMMEARGGFTTAGNRVFIGAQSDPAAGSVYVFRREASGWVFEQKVLPPDPEITKGFGFTIAATPGRLVVAAGTRSNDVFQGNTPRIYVHKISGSVIELEQTLTLP